MSRSASFDLVTYLYAPVWEADRRYKGRKYRGTGRDMREAKEFLSMNPEFMDEPESVEEFQLHSMEYLKSNHEAWVSQDHPCWGLLRHYNRCAPKRTEERPKVPMTLCVDCQARGVHSIHAVDEFCPKCLEAA